MKKYFPLMIVLLGLAVLLPTFFMDKEPDVPSIPDDLKGLFIDSPAVQLPAFTLTDYNGKPLDNSRFLGKWSLVFFGYTHCPDVCPTTLSVLEKLSRKKSTPINTQVAFISLDPKRDTAEVLKEFVTYFGDDFIGATGPRDELDKFKEPLGVVYDYEGDVSSGDYIVNHFAAIYIIDPESRQRAYILPPHSLKQVSRAYQLIRDHYK
ncbi:MAG TPA: SCO family protein [Gammaproteobacteria bacterium]|nr:SCO family protein [Gammaproteobacteria bacterium]